MAKDVTTNRDTSPLRGTDTRTMAGGRTESTRPNTTHTSNRTK